VRRTNRKVTSWLVELPLWRFLLVCFVALLAAGYAISAAGDWGLRYLFGAPSYLTQGLPPAEHVLQAAVMALVLSAFRPRWRRQLAQRREHSR